MNGQSGCRFLRLFCLVASIRNFALKLESQLRFLPILFYFAFVDGEIRTKKRFYYFKPLEKYFMKNIIEMIKQILYVLMKSTILNKNVLLQLYLKRMKGLPYKICTFY